MYAGLIDADLSERDRAILGVVATYGPPAAAKLARGGAVGIRFLTYDWALNDTAPSS